MGNILNTIYQRCCCDNIRLVLCSDAQEIYENYHDEIVDFRKADLFEEARLSIKSKSLGLLLRISGIISLLRMALSNSDGSVLEKSDIEMAMNIVNYSVLNAFSLLPSKPSNGRSNTKLRKDVNKTPLPNPENLTIEYLQQYQKVTKRFLNHDKILLATISKDKIYPVVNNESGSLIANRFVNGLQQLGFGYISPSSKSFKRYKPEGENCPGKDGLRKKYKMLNIS